MLKQMDRFTGFMGTTDTYQEADTVIVGIPMDFTVSFRPGTRQGAQAVRNISFGIEEYSVDQDKDLADYSYFDAGDIPLPFGRVDESLRLIGHVARQLLSDNKFPVFLGGEHLVSYPIIEEVYKKYPDLVVVHFDAHADLRTDYAGEPNSHATVMRKVCELIGPKNVYQFGIRSGTKDEFEYAKQNTNMFINKVIDPLREVIPQLAGRPVYVSLDIDVVDPAFAPGTGTAEPGGCSSREILDAIIALGALDIVGIDIVEISPVYDQTERTAILGAKLVREAILAYTEAKK